jgi:uncharacterized protein YjbI with pentapeptide repeats
VNFAKTGFDGDTSFEGTEFDGDAYFNAAVIEGDAEFGSADFNQGAYFFETEFSAGAYFGETTFTDGAEFYETVFDGGGYFMQTRFTGDATFTQAEFGSDADFPETVFQGDAKFGEATFEMEAVFQEVEFGGKIVFMYAEFNETAYFNHLDLEGGQFLRADLTDATFIGTNLHNANLESALLSRATLFGADLRGAKLAGAVLGDVRIDEDTVFLGRPSVDGDSSPHTFSAIRSRPCCVYDPAYESSSEHEDVDKAKGVYRALEELGGRVARPRLQSRCFVRRQDLQKDEYRREARQADTWETALVAGVRWVRAKAARVTLLYGESPWRVVAVSLGSILLFGFLYPVWGLQSSSTGLAITYPRVFENSRLLFESLYYSTLTFTTGPPGYQPLGFARVLTVLNTAIGPILVALLVFVFGRRAAR